PRFHAGRRGGDDPIHGPRPPITSIRAIVNTGSSIEPVFETMPVATRAGRFRLRRRADARRVEILRAAARVFRQRGLAAAGMREIARAADLSPGNLYHYF